MSFVFMRPQRLFQFVTIATAWALIAFHVSAAEPGISNLNIRGLQIGGMTTLVVDGEQFGTAPRLLFSFPAKVELQPGATETRATFNVSLADDVQPGLYPLRVVTDGGVTLPVVIGVDRLPQQLLAPAVASLPVALHGAVSGSSVTETKFTGKAGQRLLVEVEAERLGSKLRPVLHLYNAKRKQLAWSWNTPALAGDTRLEMVLPEDGEYTVALHDAEYGPPGPSFFRLKVGEWSYVDQLFPPVVAKGQPLGLEPIGSSPVPRIDLPAATAAGPLPLNWPSGAAWSGPRPWVQVSSQTEVVEQPPASGLQVLPAAPVGISGRLAAPNEEDRYQLSVTPGMKLRLEVFAERLGSPLDAALVVRNDKGDQLARAEDGQRTTDCVLEYAVPDATNSIVVGVIDALGRGSPRGIYFLNIEPASPGAMKSEVRLTTSVQRVSLPVGGRAVVPVYAERLGYQGPIELAASALPAGVQLQGGAIAADADGALVTVQRADAAADAVLASFRGKSADGVERQVIIKGHPLEDLQPWLASEIALAPTAAKATEFGVDWKDLPADAGLLPGQKLALPVKFFRPQTDSVVRLTLLTSQPPVLVNGQPDQNRTIRAEAPVEVAAAAVDGALSVLVPAEVSRTYYDVTLQAELLSADKRTVLATSYAPVKRLPVRHQLVLQLVSPPRIEAPLDPKAGATVKIDGKIERREGLTGDVAVTLAGLPAGARADAVTVKADASDFSVNLVLPANQPAGEVKGLVLFATAADPKQPNIRLRSRDVELTLAVSVKP